MDVKKLQLALRDFAAARDWDQFHNPKNLAMALAGEVGELVELFQWLNEEQAANLSESMLKDAAAELADISIYVLRMADKLGIDIELAINSKIASNADKYPVNEARGNAVKYNKRVP